MKTHHGSKRQPLARRYAISKKAREKERKERKAGKNNPALRKKLKKDPGIPNINPFKQHILKQLEDQQKFLKFQAEHRAIAGKEQARRRTAAITALGSADSTDAMNAASAAVGNMGGSIDLATMARDAAARLSAFTTAGENNAHNTDSNLDGSATNGEGGMDLVGAGNGGYSAAAAARGAVGAAKAAATSTRKAFFRQLRSVVEKSDIILEVLDARDPMGCRARAVEALALSSSPPKRIVLVLNKIDLVPSAVVQQWLAYLRREFPAVAFKASTQQQRSNIAAPGGASVNKATEAGEVITGAGAAGADTLLQLIKNYSRSHDLKRAVTVGIVGYPNVGKSSLINSLKRTRAVGVSSTPGFTRVAQEVSLDSKVKLLDCPGIIFDDGSGGKGATAGGDDGGAGLLLRNCISVEAIDDPEAVVESILARCAPEKLMVIYGIPFYADARAFLASVAARRGKLGKGGVPDRAAAARSVLQDWNAGRIPFFVLPPDAEEESRNHTRKHGGGAGGGGGAGKNTDGDVDLDEEEDGGASGGGALRVSGSNVGEASIVSAWSKEFDMEALLASEATMFAQGKDTSSMAEDDFIAVTGVASAHSATTPVSLLSGRVPRAAAQKALQSMAAEIAAAGSASIVGAGGGGGGDDDYDEEADLDYQDNGDAEDDDDEDDDEDDEDDDEEEEEEEEQATVPARKGQSAVEVSGKHVHFAKALSTTTVKKQVTVNIGKGGGGGGKKKNGKGGR